MSGNLVFPGSCRKPGPRFPDQISGEALWERFSTAIVARNSSATTSRLKTAPTVQNLPALTSGERVPPYPRSSTERRNRDEDVPPTRAAIDTVFVNQSSHRWPLAPRAPVVHHRCRGGSASGKM